MFEVAWPPPDVCDELKLLARPVEPGVRYTTRHQWHVTLRFLGPAAAKPARVVGNDERRDARSLGTVRADQRVLDRDAP